MSRDAGSMSGKRLASGNSAMPPKDFENESIRIWKLLSVGEGWQAVVADDFI